MQHCLPFPPAWVIVILGNPREPELFIVVWTDPLSRVDRSFLKRGINVRRRNLRRHRAELGQYRAAETADTDLQTLPIFGGVDLAPVPAAHLCTGVAAGKAIDVIALIEGVHQFDAAAFPHPRILHARVEAERYAGGQRERRVLAPVVIRRRMRALDRSVGDRIGRLQAADDFTRREHLHLEAIVGHVGDGFGENLRGAEDGIERRRETRRHAPAHFGALGDNRRRGWRSLITRSSGEPNTAGGGSRNEFAA